MVNMHLRIIFLRLLIHSQNSQNFLAAKTIRFITGVAEDQERLWRETTAAAADDFGNESEILRGGEVATDIDARLYHARLYHDIQLILSILVSKAGQLVDNVTSGSMDAHTNKVRRGQSN